MRKRIEALIHWLRSRPAYLLMTADDERLTREPPGRFVRAWLGLMLLSLGWGIASVALYGAAWREFGEYTGIQLIPVAAVVAATAIWLYRKAILALAGAFCGHGAQDRAVGASVIVVVLALMLLGLKSRQPDWATHLPWIWHWIPPTMFRVLILAPLWGAWAMLIAPQFCRPTEKTEPAVAALIGGCGPLTAAICMAGPLAATLYAFRVWGWWYLTIPAGTILAAVIGGLLLCRRHGGPTREALLAGNLLTQIVFVLCYLAVIR